MIEFSGCAAVGVYKRPLSQSTSVRPRKIDGFRQCKKPHISNEVSPLSPIRIVSAQIIAITERIPLNASLSSF